MELSHIICQATFPLKQVNDKFHTESKENLYTYLKNVFRCNYGERKWEIGYTGIQERYVASIYFLNCERGNSSLSQLRENEYQ